MEAESKRRQSGSKEDLEHSESKRDFDLRSVSGNKIFCTESRHSSASCRGRAPLRMNVISDCFNLSHFPYSQPD